jgi:dolichol-phosphate mannosyltransferase
MFMQLVQSLGQLPAVLPVPALARRFGKFGIIGTTGVGVNTIIFWVLTSRFGVPPLLASATAIEVALCSNYILNSSWTFADRRSQFAAGLAQYHVVSFGGMLINLAVLHALVSLSGVEPLIANLAGIAAAVGWNFSVNLRWTWRHSREPVAIGAARH